MLFGIDTSRWEDNPATLVTVDWQKAKAAGVGFVIMKASEGLNWVDPVYSLHSKALNGLIPRGSYHYWRPQFAAAAQAKFYYSVAGKLELPPMLDVEDWYHELPKGAALETKVLDMLKAIDDAFGQETILYTSPNIIQYYLALKPTSPLVKRKLWIAHYGVNAPDITPWKDWTFWQFTQRGTASRFGINEALSVDENWYNGDQAKFDVEFGLGKPVPADTLKVESVTVSGKKIPEMVTVNLVHNGVGSAVVVDQRPVVVPPPPKPDGAGLYRILDDVEAGIEPTGPRPYIRDGVIGPPTVKLEGGSANYRVPDKWIAYLTKINSEIAMNYIFKKGGGWQNGDEKYVVRTVTMAGNIVEVLRIEGNRAYVKTISLDDEPPAVLIKPTQAKPHALVHMFTIQYILTGSAHDPNSTVKLDYTTDGRNASILLLSPPGEQLWIDIRNLKKV